MATDGGFSVRDVFPGLGTGRTAATAQRDRPTHKDSPLQKPRQVSHASAAVSCVCKIHFDSRTCKAQRKPANVPFPSRCGLSLIVRAERAFSRKSRRLLRTSFDSRKLRCPTHSTSSGHVGHPVLQRRINAAVFAPHDAVTASRIVATMGS
jgi:hypothetical protein